MIFTLLKLPVLIVLTAARRKGLVFLVLFAAFSHLDQVYPWLGGKMTVVGTVLLPAVATWLWIQFGYAWGISARHFFVAGVALGYAGFMGLLKAWVAAAGSELPTWIVMAFTVLLGLPTLIGAGVASQVAGYNLPAATRLMHPDGLTAQLANLNPLLVSASLAVLFLSVRTVNTGRVRWLSDRPRTPEHLRAEAQNKVLSVRAAVRHLNPGLKGVMSRVRALWSAKAQRLSGDELILAADLPGPGQQSLHAIGTRAGLLTGTILARLGLQLELTPFDFNPIATARLEAHAIAYGGAGTWKTTGPRNGAVLYRDAPMVTFDVQRNAMDYDIPARIALGRNPLLFDTELADQSASINISATLDPNKPDFATRLRKRHRIILPDAPSTGGNDDLRKRTRSCLSAVHAGLITACRMDGEEATVAELYRIARSDRLVPFLKWTAEFGPETFRADAGSLAEELSHPDGNLLASMQFFIGNECAWMAEPEKCNLVDGTTDFVADPNDVVGDAGRADWIIQSSGDEVEDSPAVYQLLILEIIEAHISRTTEACHGLPRTLMLIDELPALLPALGALFTAVLERHRQKGLIAFYMMQSSEQLDLILGNGTAQRWEKNCSVVIHARPDDPDDAERVSSKVGDGLFVHESHSGASGGEGAKAEMTARETSRAISPTELMQMANGDCLVIARTHTGARRVFRGRMPNCFVHPYIRRRLMTARKAFARIQQEAQSIQDVPALPPPADDDVLCLPNPKTTK